jgi:transglutaminase-like putative cysteine protease
MLQVPTPLDPFVRASRWIDWQHPRVVERARELRRGRSDASAVSEACFVWVRDEIEHSCDHRRERVTRFASEVLEHGAGICYAKSHLLAALLRANGLPAGLVYQRLRTESRTGFCLHGLNAVWLGELGWYRLDARGRRADLGAEFAPPREMLPFSASERGERSFPGVWAEPVAAVRDALERHRTLETLELDLPDDEDLGTPDLHLPWICFAKR